MVRETMHFDAAKHLETDEEIHRFLVDAASAGSKERPMPCGQPQE